jgi:hypothetical protein
MFIKKHFFILILIALSIACNSQYVYKIKADSTLITNDSCHAELNLENGTRNVNGFLYNKGNGRTEFRRGLVKLNDTTYMVGADTLKIVQGTFVSQTTNGLLLSIDYKRAYSSQSLAPAAGTWTYDVNAGGQADVTLSSTGGRTLAFSNQRLGDIILLRFNNTSGSPITITFPSNSFLNYVSASTMTIPVGRSFVSLAGFDGTNYYFIQNTGNYATSSNKLNYFASTSSNELASVVSDETGTGSLVFGNSPTLTTPNIGAATGTSLSASGSITSSSATTGIGYATGAGGAVTQATSKTTGVTLNKISGQITMNNAALAAGAEAKFTVTNSTIAATDVVVTSIASGGTSGSYLISVTKVAAGSFDITISNASTGSLSEALIINFIVIKGAAN